MELWKLKGWKNTYQLWKDKNKNEQQESLCATTRWEDDEGSGKWAADEFRSTNGQLEWMIRESMKKSGRYQNTF